MQSSHSSNDKNWQNPGVEQRLPQEPDLSEAFRALLGLQTSEGLVDMSEPDPTAQVPPQASDPWSNLLQSQGMQPVDLQKLHLRDLHAVSNDDDDVEHALNIMREATGHLPALSDKTRDA